MLMLLVLSHYHEMMIRSWRRVYISDNDDIRIEHIPIKVDFSVFKLAQLDAWNFTQQKVFLDLRSWEQLLCSRKVM